MEGVQGFPLSPLIFVLLMETLAWIIRVHPGIQEITLNNEDYRTLLFADDILVFTSHLAEATRTLETLFWDFAQLSGLRLNISKTEVFMLKNCVNQVDTSYNIYIKDEVKYLGVTVSIKYQQLVNNNNMDIVRKVAQDLKK